MVVCGGLWWFAVFQRTVSLARQLGFLQGVSVQPITVSDYF